MSKQKRNAAPAEPQMAEPRDLVQITSEVFAKLPPDVQEIIRTSVVVKPRLTTYGQLREVLAKGKYRWSTLRGADETPLPEFSLGGRVDDLPEANKLPKIDVSRMVNAAPPANPLLLQHLVRFKILPAEFAPPGPAALPFLTPLSPGVAPAPPPPPAGATRSQIVDWRHRWGIPWITHIRDQDGCEACWAFAATALVESMVRIGHHLWCIRSEGDVHDGMGAVCASTGSSQAALDWIRIHGICDPACYPWSTTNPPYVPCADRSGRTTKIEPYTLLGSTDDQKNWLDNVGPIVTFFNVWSDFDGYTNGIYEKTAGPPAPYYRGGHLMLIVGYDDVQNFWLVKNSWGTGWGEAGYCCIAYGQCDIDTYAKIGLQTTSPDPLNKRRMHSGNMIESGNGSAHRNFEMLATTQGTKIRHWWRDNSGATFPWAQASVFGNDAAVCPTLIATTYNRNFETVYLTTTRRLHHWWLDQNTGNWNDGGVFGPTDAAGVPGFIQGNYGAPGNFEVVVRTSSGRLNHWWRSGGTWYDGGRFCCGVAFSGDALLQSAFGQKGNFELVCVLDTGEMQHWYRDNDHGNVWHPTVAFGSGIASPPCMIQGQYGMGDEYAAGNFELCVAKGGAVEHWWRNNGGDLQWRQSATFGHDVLAVASLIESSFGFNLEVVVLRTDQQLQHYWRDGGGWHEGPIIGSAA